MQLFNKSFFRFLFGFISILAIGFAVVAVAGVFTGESDQPVAGVNQNK
jgi:hypothetical protein